VIKKSVVQQNKSFKFKVAIEFAYGQQKLNITRTDGWSVLDFIILREIANSSSLSTLENLSEISRLPKQIIIQIIIPLLRMGWIELDRSQNPTCVVITKNGLVAADRNELPPVLSSYSSNREYLIDPIGGKIVGLLRYKNIGIYNYLRIQELKAAGENLVVLKIDNPHSFINEDSLLKEITYSHEVATIIDRFDSSPVDKRFVIFNVSSDDGKESIDRYYNKYNEWFDAATFDFIEKELKSLINDYKNDSKKTNLVDSLDNVKLDSQDRIPASFSICDDDFDLVLGGGDHRKLFKDLISHAESYLIIQTTYIGGLWALDSLIDDLRGAADRKVRVTILWGKDDEEFNNTSEYKDTLDYFNKELNSSQAKYIHLQEQCGSHAKFIISDHAKLGNVVVIGSCNWLYSSFDRFEASVLFKKNEIVKYFLALASRISAGKSGIHDATSNYISNLIYDIDADKKIESSLKTTYVEIVLKDQHYRYIQKAKNEALKRVLVLSDKISDVANRPILNALEECKANNKRAFYSTFDTKVISKDSVNSMEKASLEKNIKLLRHNWNRLKTNHSKVLAWDDNDLVISSLNWLSSNASISNCNHELIHEIGVYLHSPKIAKRFIAFFEDRENHDQIKKDSKKDQENS
jgi:phosphatidylserine/phosphatidylglycerophosphate/cardiolipin synthase-like enzyme